MTAASEESPKRPRVRRWQSVVVGGVILLAVAYFAAGLILSPYLKRRLQAMVAAHMNAELRIGSLRYRFPYGITVHDATLVTHDNRAPVELFSAKRIDLVLDELPQPNRPLIIKKLILNEPLVRLIKVPPPVQIVGHDLLRRDGEPPKPPDAIKLSDILRLRRFDIENGQVVFVDKTRADQKPMIWSGIHIGLGIEPSSASLYNFKIEANDAPLAHAAIEGRMDVDALRMDMSRLDLSLALKSDMKNEQVPAAVQEFIQHSALSGELKLNGSGSFPLKNLAASTDYDFHATLTDASVLPRAFPLPLRNLNGQARITHKLISLAKATGQYGEDRLTISAAHTPLDGKGFRIEDIAGVVDFAGVEQRYPKALDKTLHVLHPKGSCDVTATCAVPPGHADRFGYQVTLHADGINFNVLFAPHDRRVPTTRCGLQMTIDGIAKEAAIDIIRGDGDALGGKFAGRGNVKVAKPLKYAAEAHFRQIALPEVAKVWAGNGDQPPRLTGRVSADVAAFGSGRSGDKTALDQLAGKGEIEITDGDYFQIPVLRDVISAMKLSKDAVTVGEGAVAFHVHDRLIEFDEAAVSAPMIGLQGKGLMGFDGAVEFRVVAAPLADWKKGLKKNGLPIVSDIAGAIQKLLNGATRLALYEFRVGGKLPKVDVVTVPAPVLTDGAAKLFGKMIVPGDNAKLIENLRSEANGK